MKIIGWVLFFAVYALLFYRLLVWGTGMRIAGKASGLKRAAFFVFVALLAVVPGMAEALSRIALGWPRLSEGGFALFIIAWVVAALPGIRASRLRLRAAGINPDAEA